MVPNDYMESLDHTEDEDLVLWKKKGKSGIIFLIDGYNTMVPQTENEEEDIEIKTIDFFCLALKSCRLLMLKKIIEREKDLLGVVLYGTSTPDSKTSTNSVTQVLDLSYPSAETVKLLDQLSGSTAASQKLREEFGRNPDYSLADALWYCSSLFAHSGKTIDEKRIVLLTTKADPHAEPHKQTQDHLARKRASDLKQLKISLEVICLGNEFLEPSTFYKELLEISDPDESCLQPCMTEGDVLTQLNRTEFKKRRYAKILWELSPNIKVGVSLYTLYRENNILPQEALNRETNEPVRAIKQTYDEASLKVLLPTDLEEYTTISGLDVVFTPEEKEMLSKIVEPGLNLLGIESADKVSIATHCGHSSFAYPEEELVRGSNKILKAFMLRLIERNQVAFCSLTPRHRAHTKFVHLVPTLGDGEIPCGFHVIPLPFLSDTREQTLEESPPVDSSIVDIAERLVRKLKFMYKPENFSNPKLKKFWVNAEALALDYGAPMEIEDDTAVQPDVQTGRLGEVATEFITACSLNTSPEEKNDKRAKKRSSSPHTSDSKRGRASTSMEVIVDEIKAAIPKKKVDKYTIAQLKHFLESRNISIRGMKKADLVNAVYNLKQ